MESAVARPGGRLSALVNRYSGYRIVNAAPGVHRGLPSRHLTVIVSLDGTVDLAALPDRRQPSRSFTALAGGLHTAPALIRHDGYQFGIQLELTPLGSRALLGLPAGELAGAVVDLDAVLGSAAGELTERLRAATTWTERLRRLDETLARLVRDRGLPDAALTHAWRRLAASGGAVGISDLAAEIGWSRRHLGERFRREYGVSPKQTARVMRFERSHRLLRRADRPAPADVAARCGYFDQAHLTREWRKLAGCPPTVWLAEELPSVQDGTPPGP